jgi:hypothetical protein
MPRYYFSRCLALAAALAALPAAAELAGPTQEQVPIPGLSLEESVRLETASEKLLELASQRQSKNEMRQAEIDKLVGQVEVAAKSGDDLRFQAARERLISYIFAANNKDHHDLSAIVMTVKGTRLLAAKARVAVEHLGTETDTGEDGGFGELIEDSQDRFRDTFVTPNQREMVLASALLSGKGLSPEEEERLRRQLDQLAGFNAMFEDWEQPLTEIPYLPTQIDPAFDNQEAITFLGDLNRHLRYDYKDLEVQLFWSEILAEIGRRYAEGKLPLVRVQSALNRLSRMSGDMPRIEGKPWFVGPLNQLAGVKGPDRKTVWKMPQRPGSDSWLKVGKRESGGGDDPQEVLRRIHDQRRETAGSGQGS